MKRNIILIMFVVSLLAISFISAVDIEQSTESQKTQTLPGDSLYGLDVFFDEIRIMLSTGQQKLKIILEIADERLEEQKILIEKKEIEKSKRAEIEREKQIAKLEKLEVDKEALKDNLQNHINKLEDVRNKAPTEAKLGLNQAITSSSKVLEEIKKKPSVSINNQILPPKWMVGDVDNNNLIDVRDTKYLMEYLKGNAPAPDPILRGDVNGNCNVNIVDVVYLNAYVYQQGPAPIRGKC